MKIISLLVMLLTLAGCTQNESSAGSLLITLTTPGTRDGALVVLIAGGTITGVQPSSGYQVATTVDSIGTHLLFVGDLVAGPIATMEIPDLSHASRYVAVVEQIADRNDFTLLDKSVYKVSLQPSSSGTANMKKLP